MNLALAQSVGFVLELSVGKDAETEKRDVASAAPLHHLPDLLRKSMLLGSLPCTIYQHRDIATTTHHAMFPIQVMKQRVGVGLIVAFLSCRS